MKKTGRNWKKTLGVVTIGVASFFIVIVVIAFVYFGYVTSAIDTRMEQLRSTRPTQFYALYPSFRPNLKLTQSQLKALLMDLGYRERPRGQELTPGDYQWVSREGTIRVTLFRPPFKAPGQVIEQSQAQLVFDTVGKDLILIAMTRLDGGSAIEEFENPPRRVGAFFAGRPRTQDSVPLSEIPASARLAVMAIEDVRFLEHHGVSFRAILRALWQDIKAGRFVQGGSTLTQQLMKNLFFSKEKAVSRKLKEAFYAFVAEQRHSKESILEAYLNEVYLGQWGTREIHGFSEGAQYYFNRSVYDLSLVQSATLAAIVQAPNAQDPHRHPERLIKRRNLVLKLMRDAEFILPEEYTDAIREPLGVAPKERTLTDIYYAIDLVIEQLSPSVRSRLDTEGFTIYVTLNPHLQALAAKSLNDTLERLRKSSASIKAKSQKGIHLQGALIAIDVRECAVLALQGGSSYRQTQFNRILQGKRQAGSLFKPFVYLSAFVSEAPGSPFTPLTMLEDEPLVWNYDGQTWAPKNYDGKFRGQVSLRQALEQSLNVPTAKLAQATGIDAVYDTLTRAGIVSPIPKVPSISLGSADVTPLELARAYVTLASLGRACEPRAFTKIYDVNGNLFEENRVDWQDRLSPQATFQTVQILKGVLTHGTARTILAPTLSNFAGKTGTTNEYKDAWFVGFSPDILVLVWVGYDNEDKVGLTGAAAALPVWLDFVTHARFFIGQQDFIPPEGLTPVIIDRESNAKANERCRDIVTDYFRQGTEPKSECALQH